MAGMARANVESGIGLPCRKGVVELPVHGLIGIDAIVAIAVSGEITTPITCDTCPVEAVACVMPGRHIFDDNVICQDFKTIVELIMPIQDNRIAVAPTYGDVRRFHHDRFVVSAISARTRPDEYQVSC